MKILLTYSSKTGNTKKVADAIYEELPKNYVDFYPIEEAPSPDKYDLILLGFWVDRAMPDKKAKEYIEKVEGKKVGLFATLGEYPHSDHAKESMTNAKALLEPQNTVIAEFVCQGKIDERLTEKFKRFPPDHPHAMTPERMRRHEEARKHPDEKDLKLARQVFKFALESILREEGEFTDGIRTD